MKLNKLLTSAIITLAITTPLQAETLATGHGHDQHANALLTLDNGKKWQSDAPLRQGMQSISDAVMKNIAAFHHGKLTQADAEKLAKHINDQVTFLITNCKLESKADAALHAIIGELLSGAGAMTKDPQSMQGMPTLVNALLQYPEYFVHKDWQGIKH
jgi:hypothetical protein